MIKSLKKLIAIFTIVTFIFMTGCVGMFRSATLEPPYLPSDEKMTCDQVQNQMKQIDERAAKTNSTANGMIAYNVIMFITGFIILIPWFLMDLSGTENKEVDSMRARWIYLDDLAKTKECVMTGVKTTFLDEKPGEKKPSDKPSTFTPSGGNVVQSHPGGK